MRERRARVGGCSRSCRRAARWQERRSAAESDAMVGAYGRTRLADPAAERTAPWHTAPPCAAHATTRSAPRAARGHGAPPRCAARSARRVTPPPAPLHAYIPLPGVSRSIIDLIFIYSGAGRLRRASAFLAPSLSFAKTKTEMK